MTRSKTIMFRVTEQEKKLIDKEADKLGLSTSAFILLLIKQFSDGIRFEKKDAINGSTNVLKTQEQNDGNQ